jgi:hypothetical protein
VAREAVKVFLEKKWIECQESGVGPFEFHYCLIVENDRITGKSTVCHMENFRRAPYEEPKTTDPDIKLRNELGRGVVDIIWPVVESRANLRIDLHFRKCQFVMSTRG